MSHKKIVKFQKASLFLSNSHNKKRFMPILKKTISQSILKEIYVTFCGVKMYPKKEIHGPHMVEAPLSVTYPHGGVSRRDVNQPVWLAQILLTLTFLSARLFGSAFNTKVKNRSE